MKKLLLLAAFAVASCGGGSDECQYSTVVTTVYNQDMSPASSDTLKGCFSTHKNESNAEITDSNGKFKFEINTSPNSFVITDGEGQKRTFDESKGMQLSNTMSGDTLVLRAMPKEGSNLIKIGLEYKLYK